jgi:hypothetical protein
MKFRIKRNPTDVFDNVQLGMLCGINHGKFGEGLDVSVWGTSIGWNFE